MRKVGHLIVNSIVLFWGYFLLWFAVVGLLQVPMRAIFEAFTKWEYLWKAITSYVCMVIVCVVWELKSSTEHKRIYINSLENSEWHIKGSVLYTLKSSLFWKNFFCFSIWPIVIPTIFRAVTRLYFNDTVIEQVPLSLLVIFSIVIPFGICSFLAWQIVLYRWSKDRMHKNK